MTKIADQILTATTQIATAWMGANPVASEALPRLIRDIQRALTDLEPNSSGGESEKSRSAQPRLAPQPSVDIRKSVFRDHLICLEDGKSVTMLKRHLMTAHGLSVKQYRAKWGLLAHYPMVAPDYAKTRSKLAKQIGLGKKGGRPRAG
jgi:predicted transcriptional regulator